ncbi:MAG: hypothetical protein V4690_01750 [Patescibacteria group bacterium]
MERKVFKGLESLAEAVETLRKSPEEQIEAKLSPEDMERMRALVEECVRLGVWDDPYIADHDEDDYDDDFYDYDPPYDDDNDNNEENNGVPFEQLNPQHEGENLEDDKVKVVPQVENQPEHKVEVEPQIEETPLQKTIRLRNELRKEGSKVLLYVLDYLDQPVTHSSTIFRYSQLVELVATPKNKKLVLDFYAHKSVANSEDRSTKSYIYRPVGRIGDVNDIEKLKKIFDIEMTTDYNLAGGNPKNLRIFDAESILQALVNIRVKTTEENEIKKFNDAIDYIVSSVKQYSREPMRIPDPLDPKGVDEIHELRFLDIELKNSIKEFSDFFIYSDSTNLPDCKRRVEEINKLLEEHNQSGRFPGLIRYAYWNLALESCHKSDDEDDLKPVFSFLQELTGIKPDYQSYDIHLQNKYKENLLGYSSYYPETLRAMKKLCSLTGIKFKISPEEVRNKYLDAFTNPSQYAEDYVPTLVQLTGVEPDFKSMEKEVQKMYAEIILNATAYETDTYYGTRGLKKAEIIYKITNIRPTIDSKRMQLAYRTWIVNNYRDMKQLITAGYQMTGIEPDFTNNEGLVQEQYNVIVSTINNQSTYERAKANISEWETITKVKPKFTGLVIEDIYVQRLFRGNADSIKLIQELTQVKIDWALHEIPIRNYAIRYLTTFDAYGLNETIERIAKIQKITGKQIEFSSEELKRIASHAVRSLIDTGQNPAGAFKLEEIIPDPKFISGIATDILVTAIKHGNKTLFYLVLEKMGGEKAAGKVFNPESISTWMNSHLYSDPKKVVTVLKFTEEVSKESEIANELHKIISRNPWVNAFSRMQKIQAIAANVTNDPWEQELKPLMKYLVDHKIVSIEKAEDAELVVSFVESMGMSNLPRLFKVYADCHRSKTLDRIGPDTISICEEFGVKAKNKDGSWKFNSSLELFNELVKGLKRIKTSLLADTIPDGLKTELGDELFSVIKGSTQFERDHALSDIVSTWEKTITNKPEVAQLPVGFKESSFKVSVVSRGSEKTPDQEKALEELMSSQELKNVCGPLMESLDFASSNGTFQFFNTLLSKLASEENSIRQLLSSSLEDIESMIEDEEDSVKKQNLSKKLKALKSPKGRQGIERQADILRDASEQIKNLDKKLHNSSQEDQDYVAVLEELNKLDAKLPLVQEIRDFSALHMYGIVMDEGSRDEIDSLVDSEEGRSPNPDMVYRVHKIARDYIEEHYLHHLQDPEHTSHVSFSPELLEKLTLAWQQQLDKQTGHLPITVLKNKLDKILGVYSGKTQKEVAVSMVPVSGVLNIYSGDLGDSCHTSQHESMAKGLYPGLRTWVYVTNRGKQNEELRGSVLAIQANRSSGTPVLVVRANNPAENFIQSVNADTFVKGVLKEAIETAKRLREERIKADPSLPKEMLCQQVAIPMDSRGMASTNRQSVSDSYRKRFLKCKKIGLKDKRETNFNNYNIHSTDSATAPVVIWEIDADGNEKWYGNWE